MIKDINIHKIKFLPISQDNLILALDRLTRFKYPEVKYYRVFSELLCKYLVEPKLSKQQIYDLEGLSDFIEHVATGNDVQKEQRSRICAQTNVATDGKNSARVVDFIIEKSNL